MPHAQRLAATATAPGSPGHASNAASGMPLFGRLAVHAKLSTSPTPALRPFFNASSKQPPLSSMKQTVLDNQSQTMQTQPTTQHFIPPPPNNSPIAPSPRHSKVRPGAKPGLKYKDNPVSLTANAWHPAVAPEPRSQIQQSRIF